MNLIIRLIILNATCLLASCATPDSSNPWETPNRYIRISVSEQEQFNASLQPCVEHARKTFDQAKYRFQNGLPEGGAFYVVVFNDLKGTSYIEVDSSDSGLIRGYVNFGNSIKGKNYTTGAYIILAQSDLIDWSITYLDRPADGNLISKYILLNQDGLAAGACDPDDIEFQRFRFFAKDYSFVPPGADGWEMRAPREGQDMLMLEKGAGPNELNTLSSTRYKFPLINSKQELVDATRGFMEYAPEDPDRYTIIEHEIVPFTKKKTMPINFNSLAMCAVSRQVIADMQALLLKSGEKGTMIRETQTLVCVHPTERDRAIVLNYSHRYQPGNRDPEFSNKARQVFESIAFKTKN
jgi:hypothetical protein